MRTVPVVALLASSLLFSCRSAAFAQALPDAPSAAAARAGASPSDLAEPNPLPIVNGRHYRVPTNNENLHVLERRLFGLGALGGPAFTAAWQMARDRPDPQYWPEGAEGYFKRYGAAYGQRVIQAGTRYTFGALLHEDNRYLLCHGCTLKQKIYNAALADFTARHGVDGHRSFSPTGILAGFSGPLVAYAYWYPNQDPNYTVQRGARNSLIGFGTRPAAHLAFEILDGRRIPFTHRRVGDNRPTVPEQIPAGWTGPLPPKHRQNPTLQDPAGTYAETAETTPASVSHPQ